MAFDGIVIASLVHELNQTVLNSKISKIAQPENDELLLTCKGTNGQFRVSISASASLPFLYLTDENKPSPLTAPTFCMVLRKHIANGRITRIYQPHMERIINMEIEHLNEMGDVCHKTLIIELMGKHSNIIFCDDKGMIIDSIKHVSSAVSSLREVLPGKEYFIPATQEDKFNPLTTPADRIHEIISGKPLTVAKAIYTTFTGVSPLIASEIAYRAGIDADQPLASYSEEQLLHLCNHIAWFFDDVRANNFHPVIVRKGREPLEFAAVDLTMYHDYEIETYESISRVLEVYYAEKNVYSRIRQKSADLRRIVNVFRRTDLLDVSLIHHDDGIGHCKCLFLIVCDIDKRNAKFFFQAHKFVLHPLAQFQIQSAERFVQKQNFRFIYNRARDRDTLLLSSAQGIRHTFLVTIEIYQFQGIFDLVPDIVF